MSTKAWEKQAASLVEVQKFGGDLEKEVRDILGWKHGRVVYNQALKYKIQTDCVYPSIATPKVIASVTYSDPDTPGHSNENKLQLKLGELALFKNAYSDIRGVLVLGGTREAWLPYVLKAFEYFFDDIFFLWDKKDVTRLLAIQKNPLTIPLKHTAFWSALRNGWKVRALSPAKSTPPSGLVRYAILDALKKSSGAKTPNAISNEIARRCMQASIAAGGTEWGHFKDDNWQAIEMSRSYFNPVEAATDMSLVMGKFKFEGGLAKDVEIPSFLHHLGMTKTKLSEDFVLYSRRFKKKVYIQCKASGGGRAQHGKNIQNRTKEQTARGILYTAALSKSGELKWSDKDYHWIGILDGDWGVTKREPLKYVHMLEMAGYDKLFCAADLLNADLSLRKLKNPLIEYLSDYLDCEPI